MTISQTHFLNHPRSPNRKLDVQKPFEWNEAITVLCSQNKLVLSLKNLHIMK